MFRIARTGRTRRIMGWSIIDRTRRRTRASLPWLRFEWGFRVNAAWQRLSSIIGSAASMTCSHEMGLTSYLIALIKHPDLSRAQPERAAETYGIKHTCATLSLERETTRLRSV